MMKTLYHLLLLAAFWDATTSFVEEATFQNCPASCYCESVKYGTLTIRDCLIEPTSELYNLLYEHKIIWHLNIINAGLSSIDDIYYLNDLRSLDLNYNSLTSLPCELLKLPKLSKLVLSHNHIKEVTCNISGSERVHTLFLDNNKLKTVPCELTKLPYLSDLRLSYNDIKSVGCDMSEMKGSLLLDNNQLQSVPYELSKLPRLTTLALSHNDIQTVDCDMSQLEELDYLILADNKLKSVPCEVSKMSNLLELHLSHNAIQTVDCDMSQLVRLRTLLLDNNRLKSFPCELLKLPNLFNLIMAQNYIHTIDCDVLESQSKINDLALAYNNMTSVPCKLLKGLTKLSELWLSHNNIQTVDCDMSHLTELKMLYLDHNRLKSVPCELSTLPKLTRLDLSHNDIQKVGCDFKKLYYLSLDNNKLKSVPCELSKLQTLSELHLSHNDIQTVDCDMTQLIRLQNLYLNYNDMTAVPCKLSNAPHLSSLSLSHNVIQTIDCDMSKFSGLLTLHLDNNKLNTVPCEISKLPKLSELSLSHNAIETIDCDLAQLKGLKYLSIDYNRLTSVPCELSKLTKMMVLNISYNDIQTIDCEFKELYSLDLSYNNLTSLPLLKGIRIVNVSNNAVMQFTKKTGQRYSCKEFSEFNFQNNNISHLIDIFVGWDLSINDRNEFAMCIDRLTEHFSGNPLHCDCKDYSFYRALNKAARTWSYPCLSPISLKGQNPLTTPLDQFVCEVTEKCPVGCSCVMVPAIPTLRVSCKAYTGVVLPQNLPVLENGNLYELDIRSNHLTSLPFRPYFLNTTKAIFGHGAISEVPLATLTAFARNIKVLHLNNNQLRSLPKDITTIIFKTLVELRLDNNPWHCDCHALALRDFVIMKYSYIRHANLIRCQSPTEVVNSQVCNLARNYFCHNDDKKRTFGITVIASTFTLLLVLSVSIYILKCRKGKEGIPINVHQQTRGWAVDERADEGREFDIFVSYATEDEEYVGEWLIPELERRGFKVCFHRVHFLGGVPIHVNMHQCIIKSKRTLAFFSENFVQSTYSMYEFDLAMCIDIDAGTRRLVTIKEATLNVNTLEPSYAAYFDTHTYIAQGAVNFWKNLLFTMPQSKLGVVAEPDVDEHAV